VRVSRPGLSAFLLWLYYYFRFRAEAANAGVRARAHRQTVVSLYLAIVYCGVTCIGMVILIHDAFMSGPPYPPMPLW
jgi:hypothetical protein